MTLSIIALDTLSAKYIVIPNFLSQFKLGITLLNLYMDAISYLVEKLHETASNNWKLNAVFRKR